MFYVHVNQITTKDPKDTTSKTDTPSKKRKNKMKIRSSDGAMKKMTKRKKRTTFEICWKAANKQSSPRRRDGTGICLMTILTF